MGRSQGERVEEHALGQESSGGRDKRGHAYQKPADAVTPYEPGPGRGHIEAWLGGPFMSKHLQQEEVPADVDGRERVEGHGG